MAGLMLNTEEAIARLVPIERLTKDLRQASALMSDDEARFLVDGYYALQKYRVAAGNQLDAMEKAEEPCLLLDWLHAQMHSLERQIHGSLDRWSESRLIGRWAKSICGIGPVLSAGLMAYIDIEKAPTAGHIWRFAGLDPTSKWNEGEKRPWNASLKVLAWKIGQSFVKVQGNDKDVYGALYKQRKIWEQERNAVGAYSEQAATALRTKRIRKTTDAYKAYSAGFLPPGHIDARARRWAVKIFLSHYQAVAYRDRFGNDAPRPYAITYLDHAHELQVPNWPF